ncbi:extensin family protein [Agrobacterium rubi]|nr:extensin family protein [Agrobacterium rubi]NTF24414.1 extensin family protein [Agrobacterium rubi]
MRKFLSSAITVVMLMAGTSQPSMAADEGAGGKVVSENQCDISGMLHKFESAGSGDYGADNKMGFIGIKQWGAEALESMGYMKKGSGSSNFSIYNNANWTGKDGMWSADDFKNSRTVQDGIGMNYSDVQMKEFGGAAASALSGKSLSQNGCGPMTDGGLRMGMHLIGSGGMQEYIKADGWCGAKGATAPNGYVLKHKTQDGTGTCVNKYVCAGNKCEVVTADMNKKTCSVTMPMIKAISCSNFTGQSLALCRQAKPYLMTDAECASAEEMAEKAKKGPNEEACKNQSFGPGTGSWSYVLACSYASTVVADQDGVQNPPGVVSDPACMEKLKGMGVQFDTLGTIQNGSYGGVTCSIQNAVALTGTAIPFGARLNMTCDMAVAMEQFGQKIKGQGVTGYYGIGSTRECGPMRDKGGNKPGTITNHALGQAVDISGVIVGGRKVSMGAFVNQPGSADGALTAQLKAIACSTFRGVLSPSYSGYVGTYVHFHVEWGKAQNMCR